MPPAPVHDIEIKHADLVIATHGRGFWILDDISPLRQYLRRACREDRAPFQTGRPHPLRLQLVDRLRWRAAFGGEVFLREERRTRLHVLRARDRERRIGNAIFIDAGDARPLGVIIYYLLSDQAKDVSLAIVDEAGKEIRTFGTEELPVESFKQDRRARIWRRRQKSGQATAGLGKGLNRFIWDMRHPPVSQLPGRPPVVINPIAKPGIYQVRLTVDGRVSKPSRSK